MFSLMKGVSYSAFQRERDSHDGKESFCLCLLSSPSVLRGSIELVLVRIAMAWASAENLWKACESENPS